MERPDINDKNQYVLQTETSYPFLQEHIQNFGTLESTVEPGDEELRLKEAFEYLNEGIKGAARSIQEDTTLTDDKKRAQLTARLIQMRDKILRLKVIVITLNTEDDAYLIFETLNTRGRDLTVSDLVRTHVTRMIPQRNANVDTAKDRFNKVVDAFEASDSEASVNSFLHHYWLSKYDYITETIRTKDQAKGFLQSFESDADVYRLIHEPNSRELGRLTLDMSRMTIEHLAHQSQGKGRALTDEQVAEIGNLLLVDQDLNEKLGTKPFPEKIKLLKAAPAVWTDDVVSKQTSWGQNEIRKRTDHLAKLAFDKVWSI